MVAFEEFTEKFGAFLQSHFAGWNVAVNPVTDNIGSQYFVGAMPKPGQSVRFHGTNFCSGRSILDGGAKAVVCQRKGAEREVFGRVLFTTGSMHCANAWSQFVDLGPALDYEGPIGWFANCVAILPDATEGRITSFQDIQPMGLVVNVKMEWEVAQIPSFVSPHYGEFSVAA